MSGRDISGAGTTANMSLTCLNSFMGYTNNDSFLVVRTFRTYLIAGVSPLYYNITRPTKCLMLFFVQSCTKIQSLKTYFGTDPIKCLISVKSVSLIFFIGYSVIFYWNTVFRHITILSWVVAFIRRGIIYFFIQYTFFYFSDLVLRTISCFFKSFINTFFTFLFFSVGSKFSLWYFLVKLSKVYLYILILFTLFESFCFRSPLPIYLSSIIVTFFDWNELVFCKFRGEQFDVNDAGNA